VPVVEAGASEGEGDLLAAGDVRGAGDPPSARVAGLDRRQNEAIGVGVALDLATRPT
jgi:hypothetical protein